MFGSTRQMSWAHYSTNSKQWEARTRQGNLQYQERHGKEKKVCTASQALRQYGQWLACVCVCVRVCMHASVCAWYVCVMCICVCVQLCAYDPSPYPHYYCTIIEKRPWSDWPDTGYCVHCQNIEGPITVTTDASVYMQFQSWMKD